MKVAFKLHARRKGKFQMLDSKKNVTFNEFYYIAFTHTREARAKLFGQDDGAVFFRDPG